MPTTQLYTDSERPTQRRAAAERDEAAQDAAAREAAAEALQRSLDRRDQGGY